MINKKLEKFLKISIKDRNECKLWYFDARLFSVFERAIYLRYLSCTFSKPPSDMTGREFYVTLATCWDTCTSHVTGIGRKRFVSVSTLCCHFPCLQHHRNVVIAQP